MSNARGASLAAVEITDAMRRGVVALPTGAWFTPSEEDATDQAGNPNVLTRDVPTSSFGQGCAAQTCLVEIARWDGPAPDATAAYDAALRRRVPA